MPAEKAVYSDDLKNMRVEAIFYLTLLVSLVLAGYILWDIYALLFHVQNTHFAVPEMSTAYLVFLAAYTGYKEYRRWMTDTPASRKVVPKEQVIRLGGSHCLLLDPSVDRFHGPAGSGPGIQDAERAFTSRYAGYRHMAGIDLRQGRYPETQGEKS